LVADGMVFWSFLQKSAVGLFFNEVELKPIMNKGTEYKKGKLTKKSSNQNAVLLFFKTGSTMLVLDASL